MKVRLYAILKFIYQLKKSQYLAQISNDVSIGKGSTTDLLGNIWLFDIFLHCCIWVRA